LNASAPLTKIHFIQISKSDTRLQKKLCNDSDRGIVAVAIDKVCQLNNKTINLGVAISAGEFAMSLAKDLRLQVLNYQRTWVDPRVVGIMSIIRFLTRNPAIDQHSASYVLALVKFTSPPTFQTP